MNSPVYLDYNATTPIHPKVKEKLIKAMDYYGNPSSLHQHGRFSREQIEKAREKVATFINANANEIIFTGSGSEANNSVFSVVYCCSSRCASCENGRNKIITTAIEHPCILETSKCLGDRGATVEYLSVDALGRISLEELEEKVDERTALVSIMTANNEIGTIQDIKKMAEISKKKGALFHTDAVQAVGKIPVDVQDMGVDFLTLSAHKIYGPKGIGALFVRSGSPFCPLIHGGHQERGRRAGTENTLGIIGLGAAIKEREIEMEEETKRLLKFKGYMKEQISAHIPQIRINGHPEHSLPNTLNISFSGAEGEALLLYLDHEGISVSTGSACASGSLNPSHVLLACGLQPEFAHGSLRISMGRDTTLENIDYFLEKLEKIVKKVRNMSSAYQAE